jgi:hypothetical protein
MTLNERSQKFYCPICQQRLWRLGSQKQYLLTATKTAIATNSHQRETKVYFFNAQSIVDLDRASWREEFFCEAHGKIWMELSSSVRGDCLVTEKAEM